VATYSCIKKGRRALPDGLLASLLCSRLEDSSADPASITFTQARDVLTFDSAKAVAQQHLQSYSARWTKKVNIPTRKLHIHEILDA
jgi:hypothetical protein